MIVYFFRVFASTEYTRPRWTFHAKGLWYSPPGDTRPILTMVGSPNFGYRFDLLLIMSNIVIGRLPAYR